MAELQLGEADRDRVLVISAATTDRLLVDVKIAATGGRWRRAGFYSAIRREVPIRTFNDWNSPPPGFCDVDMVAHGGSGGWLVHPDPDDGRCRDRLDGVPAVSDAGRFARRRAINRAQSPFPWLLRGWIAAIEGWLATQPQLTALAIVGRLRETHPEEFGTDSIRSCSVC